MFFILFYNNNKYKYLCTGKQSINCEGSNIVSFKIIIIIIMINNNK